MDDLIPEKTRLNEGHLRFLNFKKVETIKKKMMHTRIQLKF